MFTVVNCEEMLENLSVVLEEVVSSRCKYSNQAR